MNPSHFGEHIILALSGTTLSDLDKKLLSTIKPIGILFLGRNFAHGQPYHEWLPRWEALLKDIHQYTERAKMFFTLDHEGGHVHRAPLPFTRQPYAIQFGEKVEQVAKAHGTELTSLGINVSWAPVTDVHSNPSNPVIGVRAFHTDPYKAAELSARYVTALQKEGVLGCAKHFPGHGDTSADSHFELPVLHLTESELRARELIPFKKLAEMQVPFMMTAHVQFPKFDSEPATFSKKALIDILRTEYRYEGIVVSDDIEMKAVANTFTTPDAVAKLFNAGCDTAIIARYPDPNNTTTLDVTELFLKAVTSGLLKEETLERSKARIKRILDSVQMHRVTKLDESVFKAHSTLAIELSM